jgi:hypothetical protein
MNRAYYVRHTYPMKKDTKILWSCEIIPYTLININFGFGYWIMNKRVLEST